MANSKLKEILKKNHLTQWELADILGVHENTLCRKLRRELSQEEQQKIIAIIEENKKGA